MSKDIYGITVSIVVHQNEVMFIPLVEFLISNDLIKKIIITNNNNLKISLPESEKIKNISNEKIKSYSENNNSAFKYCNTKFFLILNPDINLKNLDFKKLIDLLNIRNNSAVLTPNICDRSNKKNHFKSRYDLIDVILSRKNFETINNEIKEVRFISGCFMLFKSESFELVKGFDIRYRLYLEDYDICNKIKMNGMTILVDGTSEIEHKANRASKKSVKYLTIHIISLVKYYLKWGYKFE